MMKPAEAVGSVPQPGVNPAAQAPAAGQKQNFGLSEADLNALRGDREVADVFNRVAGTKVPMDQVDPQSLAIVAGMVQKLGVDGAVAAIDKMLSPEQKAAMQAEAAKSNGGGAPAPGGPPAPAAPGGMI